MIPSSVALSVRGVGKTYQIARNSVRHTTLAEALLHRLRQPIGGSKTESFCALSDVSFDVNRGEVVGIIGRNGAGKSTLLKMLSRITEPTAGRMDLYGRVGSLLEVGTGFHPELTGRENVYLNGQILGMRRSEIERQFDAIVDFAGVEQFLDTPVKRYSSGMYVRLAFAVAAHLQSEILVVDEVLAVGDAEFQARCLGKMRDVATGGRTVLFVSHNMQAVNLLCQRAVLLEKGRVSWDGDVREAVRRYMQSYAAETITVEDIAAADRRPGTGEYRCTSARPAKPLFDPGEPVTIEFAIRRRSGYVGHLYISLHIVDFDGVLIAQCDSRLVGVGASDCDELTAAFQMNTPWLKPGGYRLDMFICGGGVIDKFEAACELSISPKWPYPFTVSADGVGAGVVLPDFGWTVKSGRGGMTLMDSGTDDALPATMPNTTPSR